MNIFRSLYPFLKDFFGSFGPKGKLDGPNSIILPYRGMQTHDAAAFYCPYVPLISTSPSNALSSLDGFKTRYGVITKDQINEDDQK